MRSFTCFNSWVSRECPIEGGQALTVSPMLENSTATFNNTLGGTKGKGFIGTVNGRAVAVQVYAVGPLAGQFATAVVRWR